MFKNKIKKYLDYSNLSKPIFISGLILVVFGFVNFLSASLGILNNNELKFFNILEGQIISYVIGIAALIVAIYLPYKLYYKTSVYIFALSVIVALLVFVPGIGLEHGGARRWIDLHFMSFQPSETLKLAAIIITSWFVYKFQNKLDNFIFSVSGFGAILAICALIMFLQKDLGTLLVIAISAFAIYFTNGAKIKHLLVLSLAGLIIIAAYAYTNPYIISRFNVYKNNTSNTLGSAYQTKQALIAISSGGVTGRGIGQSIQKFGYLPEPVGDSIFAVSSEEFGLIGSTLIIFLFGFIIVYSLLRTLSIKNIFAKGLIIGITTLFFSQTVLNIASMIGLIPLSGDTLPFFSQGGTALIVNMFQLGLLLQLTKHKIII